MISFETGSFAFSKQVVEASRMFRISVSFGSVHSSISLPGCMSHASTPAWRGAIVASFVYLKQLR